VRADLHLHSYYSGQAGHLRFLRARDSYSDPMDVYRAAKARGMDLVTITDHDTIDGCLAFLDRRPDAADFFVSEEIECRLPGADLRFHLGAYGITERIHREIQPLRANVVEAAAYLRAEQVFFALNHPFFYFRHQLPLGEYLEMARRLFPAVEVRNGTMLRVHNQLAERMVRRWQAEGGGPGAIGGSDAHTLRGIGTTWTEAPGASPADFLRSLAGGLGRPGGVHGGVWREAREIYGVVGRYWKALLGFGPDDLSPGRRAFGLAFSAVSLPFEFFPVLIAARHKRVEAEAVARCRREWEAEAVPAGDRHARLAAPGRAATGQAP
jgi:predicted metal-dependent phosphoesterase TrpH